VLVANAGGHGYYRTRYDQDSLAGLISGFSRLEDLEQLTLASDTWAGALAGTGPLADFVSLTAKLDADCDPAAWSVVHDCILLLDRTVAAADRPALRSWCTSLMWPALERLGWQGSPGESARRDMARSILIRDLGVVAADDRVIERARAIFGRRRSGPGAGDPGTWGAIMSVVASAGGAAERAEFRARYEHPASPQERQRNRDAMIELRQPEQVSEVLSMCLAGMRGEDVADVLRRMLGTPHGGPAAWDFLRGHWATLIPAQPEKSVWRIMSGLSGLLRTEAGGAVPDSADIRSFVAAHPLGGLQQLVDQSLELLDVRLAFVRRERARLRQVLSAPQAP
jgi:aminopeptidase N